ncbi:MAG: putative glycoside hydrolase [Endomicrobiaceae bacterium]|nr:putative glycoside hydrolase [Endomicrobiaceae bacterium]MDD3922097.1 putative glycoside hydrolase [Endomicrobiaceae bacterium]
MKKSTILLTLICLLSLSVNIFSQEDEQPEILVEQNPTLTTEKTNAKGMHLSIYVAASAKHKERINDLLDTTELNTVVIDVKEIDGHISVKNVANNLSYSKSVPDISSYLSQIKEKGIYTIARIVVFRDNVMPRKRPELAVKTPEGNLWQDRKNITWLNPYNQEAVNYILDLAEKTADMGFDEIQFDYIRFPSDGKTSLCRYGVRNSSMTPSDAIVDFLRQAKERLSPKGIKTSIDVFGLTTTEKTDMGIGQKIVEMAEYVDYISPMIYPSHYANGEYGIPNPNKEPYRTVYIALQGAKKRLPVEKLRPWLQDFSMKGVKYGPKELQSQIQACYDCDVKTWMLWNAACKYTKTGLKTKEAENSYEKTSTEKIRELLKHDNINSAMQKRTTNKSSKKLENKSTKTTNMNKISISTSTKTK